MKNLSLLIFLSLIIAAGCFADEAGEADSSSDEGAAAVMEAPEASSEAPAVLSEPSPKVMTPAANEPEEKEDEEATYELVRVKQVIEGSIIRIDRGEGERVRLIGVHPPETFRIPFSMNFWGHQAREFMSYACLNKLVRLEYDDRFAKDGHKDENGNTLAYVYLEDGRSLNELIIREGFASVDPKEKIKYAREYAEVMRKAKKKKKGIWGKSKSAMVK